ncbi:MAG: hypothetical protein Alpg2KO_16870 [Alphaproteobacteria bacterium]
MSTLLRRKQRKNKRKTPTIFLWFGVIAGIAIFAACFVEAITVSTIWRHKVASEGRVVSCQQKQLYHELITPNELVVRYRVLNESNRVVRTPELRSIYAQWSCSDNNPGHKVQVYYAATDPEIAMTAHRYQVSMLTVIFGVLIAVALMAVCGGRIYARARAKILAQLDEPLEPREERA